MPQSCCVPPHGLRCQCKCLQHGLVTLLSKLLVLAPLSSAAAAMKGKWGPALKRSPFQLWPDPSHPVPVAVPSVGEGGRGFFGQTQPCQKSLQARYSHRGGRGGLEAVFYFTPCSSPAWVSLVLPSGHMPPKPIHFCTLALSGDREDNWLLLPSATNFGICCINQDHCSQCEQNLLCCWANLSWDISSGSSWQPRPVPSPQPRAGQQQTGHSAPDQVSQVVLRKAKQCFLPSPCFFSWYSPIHG